MNSVGNSSTPTAGPLLVPVPALVEVCHLLQKRLGPRSEAAFLDAVRMGQLELVPLTEGATIDRRHLAAVRPSHVEALKLLP